MLLCARYGMINLVFSSYILHIKEADHLMSWELILVFVLFLLGSFVQGVSGFGFGLVVMGILPIFFTIKDSTLLVMALTLFLSLNIVRKIYKHIELKSLVFILGAALLGRLASFFILSTYGELDILKIWLGFFLIGMVVYLLLKKDRAPHPGFLHPVVPIILGLTGGLIGGIFSVGGPFFVFYFMLLYQDKHKYNANLQTTFLCTSLFSLVLHSFNGDLNLEFVLYFAVGLGSVLLGSTLGLKWFEKLPHAMIKKMAMGIVLLSALNLIFLN